MTVNDMNRRTNMAGKYPRVMQRTGLNPSSKAFGVPGAPKPPGPFVHQAGLHHNQSRMDANVSPNPEWPIMRYGFTIPAGPGTFQVFEVTDCRTLYLAESIILGTGAGELSIQFGETGDPIRLAPGDLIKLSGFRRFKIFNNTNAIKSAAIIVTADPNFSWQSFPRGV